jgi:hypothetical protein
MLRVHLQGEAHHLRNPTRRKELHCLRKLIQRWCGIHSRGRYLGFRRSAAGKLWFESRREPPKAAIYQSSQPHAAHHGRGHRRGMARESDEAGGWGAGNWRWRGGHGLRSSTQLEQPRRTHRDPRAPPMRGKGAFVLFYFRLVDPLGIYAQCSMTYVLRASASALGVARCVRSVLGSPSELIAPGGASLASPSCQCLQAIPN